MHSELVMTNLPEQHEISPFTLSFAHLDTHTHQCVVRIVSLMSWFGCSWVMGMSAWWDLTPVQPGRVYWVHPTPRAAKGPILTDSSACNCWQRWHRFVDGAIMTWPQAVCRKYLCPLLQVELQFEFWFRENKSELKFNSVDACSLRGATTDPKTLISEPIDSHRMAISRRFPKLLTDIPTKDSSVVQSATWCMTMTRKTCFGCHCILTLWLFTPTVATKARSDESGHCYLDYKQKPERFQYQSLGSLPSDSSSIQHLSGPAALLSLYSTNISTRRH